MPNDETPASALELWAAARERAIAELSRKAATLAENGRSDDAERLGCAARLLALRAMHERARAAALRARAELLAAQ
jgi:hypothetical protein